MANNPFRHKQGEDKLAEAFKGVSLNPEDDPEQQPPPYSLPEPQVAPASASGATGATFGYPEGGPVGQAYDQSRDKSLPGVPGEASSYYNNQLSQQPSTASGYQAPVYFATAEGSRPTEGTKGPSAPSSSFFDRVTGSFAPKRNPLDPPPSAFTRPIAAYLDPRPFPPLSIQSHKASLQDGFPALPAAPEMALPPGAPHPFSTHDIPEADWLRFLEDIGIIAKLNGMKKAKAQIIPAAMGVSLPIGFLISRGIQKKMQSGKNEDAADLVDTWNQFFFQPRHVRAILTQGSMILTAPEGGHSQAHMSALSTYGVVPGGSHHGHRRRDSSSSSSSSSSSDDDHHHQGQQHPHQAVSRREEKQMRRAAKREYREKRREDRDAYRAERRARRQERRSMKGERKHGSKEKFRLVLVPC